MPIVLNTEEEKAVREIFFQQEEKISFEDIKKIISDYIIQPETEIVELGLDSMGASDILLTIEKKFGIKICHTIDRSKIKTIGDLHQQINKILGS